MSEPEIVCPRCRAVSPPGTEYCRRCGEILGQNIKAELQRLAIILRDLDARIAANKGSQTVASLRQEYFSRYEEMRRPPWRRGSPAVAPAGWPARQPAASEVIPPAPAAAPAFDATRMAAPAPSRPAAAPAAPAGPVFSWRAFAADQTIAIMAYLGGFLALVATLTLVVSKGANLPTLTLGIVALVYISFGSAGLGLRKIDRLRTVSRVYLAVFALMTPLVALAVYRYQLQQLNVPVAGMLCISAVYAAVVYLGLAVQTRFATYAYLGWTALIVAALAIIPWTNSDLQWWVLDLGVTALALLGPHHLRRQRRLGILAEPATQVAALATIAVVLGVQALGFIGLTQTLIYNAFPSIPVHAAPLALGACIQVPITAGWRLTAPSWRPRQQNAIIDTIDGFNAVFFAEAVGGVTLWIANLPLELVNRPLAIALAATALFEFALALAIYRWQPRRRALRAFLEVFAVGLASGGAFIMLGVPTPNWPLSIALSAALAVSLGAAIIDGAWWLLVGGFFLLLDYYQAALAVLPAEQAAANRLTLYFALTLALWLAALAAGLSPRGRRFVAPIYVVALGSALVTLIFMPRHDAGYQTAVLLTFAAAAFSAGMRERQPIFGGFVAGFFGVLLPLPLALGDPNGLHISLLALGLALVALAVRRRWGRLWALVPYGSALWAVMVAAVQTGVFGLRVPDWSASGLPFTAWFLLFFAALSYGVALWEREPLATLVPAALALAAVFLLPGPDNLLPTLVLTFAFTAIGAALRLPFIRARVRRAWTYAPYVAAIGASIFAAERVVPFDAGQVEALLLVFAAVAYALVVLEGKPLAALLPLLYALASVFVQPDAHALLPLALSFALLGLVVGRLVGIRWSWTFYAAAAVAAAATVTIGQREAAFEATALLILAALAYVIAAVESRPDVLIAALALGLLALGAGIHALHLLPWQGTLAFVALGWLYYAGAALWLVIPWLRPTRGAWWLGMLDPQAHARWRNPPAAVGALVHQVGGLLVVAGAALVGIFAQDAFTIQRPQTLAAAASLLALAALLAIVAQRPAFHPVIYLSGELVALSITWVARWLGADNVQAFVLAPGSYQLLVGAFLPADLRVPHARRVGQFATLTASLLLLLPTLYQTYTEPSLTGEFIYGSVVLVESLVIIGLGVGTHTRLLVLVGSAFIGIDTLSGVALALKNGAPVALVVGFLALLLIGLATWLSLRMRRESTPT